MLRKTILKKRNAKAAEVVNILVQLEGISEDRAFTLLLRSQFGMALINEITKAWHYPEYWAYVSICREMDMEPKPPAPEGIYDRTHIAEYIRRADHEYGLRNRSRKNRKTRTF